MINVRIPEGPLSDFLLAEAERRACRPDQLGLALIRCATEGDLVEAVLDGFSPGSIMAPRNTRQSLQVRVMRTLPAFKAPNGTILASITDIARRLDYRSRGAVRNAILALIEKRLIVLHERGKPGKASRYRFTPEGEAFLRETDR